MSVGELIRARRKARGWSQETLAEKMGWQQTYLSRVERGEVEVPQRATLERLGNLLGVTLEEFYRAAGMLEGIAEGNGDGPEPPPVREDQDYTEAEVKEIVDWVKALPGAAYQRIVAENERDLSPEDFIAFCLDAHQAWMSNLRLAHKQQRRRWANGARA